MNAKPLFTEDKADVVAYYCSECRIVKKTPEEAEECCKTPLCGCGAEVERLRTTCRDCKDKAYLRRLKEELAQAKRVSAPTVGMVYSDDINEKDGYFNLGEIKEIFDDPELDMPLFVYDCVKQKWAGLDASGIIDNSLEGDWFDGADEHIVKQDELERFLATWNKQQTLHQFMVNRKQIIVINETEFDKWLAETDD